MRAIRIVLVFCILSIFDYALADEGERMSPWTLEEVKAALTESDDFHPFPVYQDREAWARLKGNPLFMDSFEGTIAKARELAKQDMPWLRASIYLDFQRTGRRDTYESLLSKQNQFLSSFALAECLEGQGEFLDPLMDALWRYCETSDWCYSAHTDGLPDMEKPHIDLGASHIAAALAEIANVFGDALSAPTRKRIDYELNRRIFEPYLTRDFSWRTNLNNWNAVCNGNVLRAALYSVRDKERLAQIVQRAQNGMTNYLKGFGADGGTAEGISYWNYGFGNYVDAAYLLNLYTDKKLNLLAPPIVKEIAQFPARIEMSVGKYPTFSDSSESSSCPVGMMTYLGDALGLPRLRSFAAARRPETLDAGSLRALFYDGAIAELSQKDTSAFGWDDSTFLNAIEWMIARVNANDPDSLVLVAKGGRNDEPHNHNDVGNFIVHAGGESLIVDVGAPVYDRDFFRRDKRYSYFAARSMGHSLPVVNGQEQRDGSFSAKNVESTHTPERDSLTSDISDVYPPEAGLQSLVRTISLAREGKGKVELTDHAVFVKMPHSFESALITFGAVDISQKGVVAIRGEKAELRVEYDPGAWETRVDDYSSQEAKLRTAEKYPTIRRIAFRCLKLGMEIDFTVAMTPKGKE